ncbi:hypothetical protein MES4922_500030 [Mesorhizobium ventifaucium]|uniref:Propionyl-coenzyme A carboxylase alpha polypeptide n=1 Tax=Mesorhizobium ventifaucium TaxID=666020 RepID=A0ABN8KA70_9HYPH|nr:hypothetical protein MES4922_500030 [Mesorhizobium ventifaucium]
MSFERPRGRNGAPAGPPRRSPPLGAGGRMLAKVGDLRKNGVLAFPRPWGPRAGEGKITGRSSP